MPHPCEHGSDDAVRRCTRRTSVLAARSCYRTRAERRHARHVQAVAVGIGIAVLLVIVLWPRWTMDKYMRYLEESYIETPLNVRGGEN